MNMNNNSHTNDIMYNLFDSENDWEDYDPGLRVTAENQEIILDKKNQVFLYDILSVKTQVYIDYQI